MSRNCLLFLQDIIRACEKIIRYTRDLSNNQFFGDEKNLDAVLRNPEIVGEAVKKLPLEVWDRYPEVEWGRIARFRDIAIYDYFGIDEDIL